MQLQPSGIKRARQYLFLVAPILGFVAIASTVSGCMTKNLHASYGRRYHDVQNAQLGARGTHEPVARGEESARAVDKYYQSYNTNGVSGPSSGGSNKTAGISPLN